MNRNTPLFLFNDLATLIEAGVTPVSALKKLADGKDKNWQSAITHAEKGSSFSLALAKSQLVDRYETEILAISEKAGRLPEGLRKIAVEHDNKRIRRSKIKTRIILPFAIYIIAIFVRSLMLALNDPDSTVLSALTQGIMLLLIGFIITRAILKSIFLDPCSSIEKFSYFSNHVWYRRLFEQVIFGALVWQLRSGIDASAALKRSANLIKKSPFFKNLQTAATHCQQGQSVSDSLSSANLPVTNGGQAIIRSSEASGSLQHALEKYLTHEAKLLENTIELFYDWVPRLYYGLVAIVAISVIV
ncbi:type II secretion system F family protein [Pleionea sediminis]|uniref:type II secretion system F family protein n=1 Tax=Pleionea sediminis TaxID=2569479 RepID=UPI0011866F37|nr:type II secretion system F family protein [Pleionea sediminis]